MYSSQDWTPERWDAIEDAGDLLGWELVPITGRYGAVEIVWWKGGQCDESRDASGCASTAQIGPRRKVYAVEDGTVLAHEIGHAFGFKHNPNAPGDLMHPKAGTEYFLDAGKFDAKVGRFQDWVVTIHD